MGRIILIFFSKVYLTIERSVLNGSACFAKSMCLEYIRKPYDARPGKLFCLLQ